MVGEIVEHARFGRGTVTAFEPPRMVVRSDASKKAAERRKVALAMKKTAE